MGLVDDIHRAREKFLSSSVVIYDNLNYVKLLNVIKLLNDKLCMYNNIGILAISTFDILSSSIGMVNNLYIVILKDFKLNLYLL